MPAPTAGLVLAAGAGLRLGLGTKALLPFQGRPLIEHILTQLRNGGCSSLAVVLGAQADEVMARAELGGCRAVINPDWNTGMGLSFRRGAESALAAEPDAAALLVALVDQPGLSAAVVSRLIRRHQPGRITAAGYRQAGSTAVRRGHPLIFTRDLAAAAAAQAKGDAGAREFLRANASLVDVVDCSDLADGQDLDTAADLPLLGDTSKGQVAATGPDPLD
ncbi:nucleotidyltransferase family protein [Arthrobacter gengyunqii]|uniref:Nucleotidyltransferase family protein n=1 Tax=Arthrobacter gengyunqii TaxID=2886940 RepID=A0A9X1LZ89_9MICC|nr:nucleotidyltransferase family protein [Arthrobacter gengyunqii]MCC3268281.1 nucleotidyltransferase family protein [Arthrobacter gengyunqii]UOY95687.1 nucleotidyltransferase family protein [Arthrobacter gengyunqii]